MTAPLPTRGPLTLREPWFRRYPLRSVGVSALLFLAVLAIRLLDEDASEPVSLLYALPVALLAVTFGVRGGVAAGVVAIGLTAFWRLVLADAPLTLVGWISRAVPLVLLGVLLGRATDDLRSAEAERRRLEQADLLHREAIEINDSLVQGMAAAKWAFEAGRVDSGLEILDDTLNQAHELVSGLIRRAEMGDRAHSSDAS